MVRSLAELLKDTELTRPPLYMQGKLNHNLTILIFSAYSAKQLINLFLL
jgi:hypothetical protein